MTESFRDRKRVHLWIQECFLKTEEETLLTPAQVKHLRSALVIEWGSGMGTRIGTARYRPSLNEAKIRLSTPLWEVAPEDQKRETVFHEFAHLVVAIDQAQKVATPKVMSFGRKRRSIHGPEWRYVMHKLGYPNASRCHEVVNEEFERNRGRVQIFCACQAEPLCWAFPSKANFLARNICAKCKQPFRVGT